MAINIERSVVLTTDEHHHLLGELRRNETSSAPLKVNLKGEDRLNMKHCILIEFTEDSLPGDLFQLGLRVQQARSMGLP